MKRTPRSPEAAPLLPRRVIDVGEDSSDIVQLNDFGISPPKAHYICLSHRWKRSNPLTSTNITISTRLSGIDLKDLSPTLQDAVHLARGFNIRYVWVDSLCILQDSTTDWELESAKMGTYYSKCWLTIAAGLDDPESGLFGRRYPEGDGIGYYRLKIALSNTQPGDTQTEASIYFTGLDESGWDNRSASLLFTRGWTLQEEALSPRILSFLPRETSLRIEDVVYHESGNYQTALKGGYFNANSPSAPSWTAIVEDYSKR
jgi:hypothetical protein